ncbi:MAG: hypothetical protein RIB60_01920 [Phycisphaerales bacterium]
MRFLTTLLLLPAWMLTGCAAPGGLPAYPHPISNNAVTSVPAADGNGTVYSFMGIIDPADTGTITPAAYALDWPHADAWRRIADVPLDEGRARIGASAVTIRERVFVVGGYSVLDDGSERTDPRLLEYVIDEDRWVERAPPPVEVDDTLAVVQADRWLYLVSGWHGPAHDNVLDVQVWDIETDEWRACTPLPGPGTGLFGHAGGIVSSDGGDTILVIDGVKRDPETRSFVISDAVFVGAIDPDDPTRIAWREQSPHPGEPTYRAANASAGGAVLIAGGTSTPYNIDGVGYDGTPAEPLAQMLAWSPGRGWSVSPAPAATMDHRGLVRVGDSWAVIGGMTAPRRATRAITVQSPADRAEGNGTP